MTRMPKRAAGAGRLRLDRDLDRKAETRLACARRRIISDPVAGDPSEQEDLPDAVAAELEQ